MQKALAILTVAAVLALGLLVPRGSSAPALPDRPARYEYAELRYSRAFVAPPGGGFAPGGGIGRVGGDRAGVPAKGGVRGAGPDRGGPVEGPFGGAGQPGLAGGAAAEVRTVVRWTTAEEEVEVKEWEELADKLKARSPKKVSPSTVHKLRVLNKLSEDGWELMDRPSPDTSSGIWTFRRLAK